MVLSSNLREVIVGNNFNGSSLDELLLAAIRKEGGDITHLICLRSDRQLQEEVASLVISSANRKAGMRFDLRSMVIDDLLQVVHSTNYSFVHQRIPALLKGAPPNSDGFGLVRLKCFEEALSPDQALERLKKEGNRPAGLRELIALGFIKKFCNSQISIVALAHGFLYQRFAKNAFPRLDYNGWHSSLSIAPPDAGDDRYDPWVYYLIRED